MLQAHLPAHLTALQERIGSPSLIVALDGGCGDFDRPWLASSMRGKCHHQQNLSADASDIRHSVIF